MGTVPTDDNRAGIVMIGEDGQHQLAFALCLGIDLTESSLEIVTFTAGSDSSDIHLSDPRQKPSEIRSEIIDHKLQLSEEKKNFYLKEIENRLVPYFRQHLDGLVEKLRNEPIEEVESFLHQEISGQVMFSTELLLKVFAVDYQHLELSDDSPEDKVDDPEETRPGRDIQILEISPVINATQGGTIENLEKGTEVLVRLAGKSAELMGFSEEDDKLPPPLPADFLKFEQSQDNTEGTLEVKLQEGIHGRCDVPEGTKVHETEEPEFEEPDPYLQRIEVLVSAVVALLVVVVGVTIFLVVS